MIRNSEGMVVTTIAALRPPVFSRASSPKACPASSVRTPFTVSLLATLMDTDPVPTVDKVMLHGGHHTGSPASPAVQKGEFYKGLPCLQGAKRSDNPSALGSTTAVKMQ